MAERSTASFGKYKSTAVLARGGIADLHDAVDTENQQHVLLRVVHSSASENPQIRRLFHDLQASNELLLDHPNILSMLGSGRAKGRYYFAFERVEGQSLASRLKKGAVEIEEWIEIVRQMAEGLRAAHRMDIAHGDLKPANIYLTKDRHGRLVVKVAFFDLAVAGAESMVSVYGELVGTPKYLAPERIRGEACDGRADIFALGVISYEMLTGEEPFPSETNLGYLWQNVHGVFRWPLDMEPPREAANVVEKMLGRHLRDRYQTCQNVLDDLDRCEQRLKRDHIEVVPLGVDSAFAFQHEPRRRRRSVWKALAAAALVVALGGGGIYLWSQRKRTPKSPEPVAQKAERRQAVDNLMALARHYEATNDHERALEEYHKLVNEYPESSFAAEATRRIIALGKPAPAMPAVSPPLPLSAPAIPPTKPAQPETPAQKALAEWQKTSQTVKNLTDDKKPIDALRMVQAFLAKHGDAPIADAARVRSRDLTFLVADAYAKAGKFQEAVSMLKAAAGKWEDTAASEKATRKAVEIETAWGNDLFQRGDYAGAATAFEAILNRVGESPLAASARARAPEALFRWASSLAEKGSFDEALQRLRELGAKYATGDWAGKAEKEIPAVQLKYALALRKRGEPSKAMQILEVLAQRDGNDEWAQKAAGEMPPTLYEWAGTLFDAGKKAEAHEKYRELQRKYARTPWANAHQQDFLALGQKVAGVRASRPTISEAQRSIAEALRARDTGDVGRAQTLLERVLDQFPNTTAATEAAGRLGVMLFREGRQTVGRGETEKGWKLLQSAAARCAHTGWGARAQRLVNLRNATPSGMVFVPGGMMLRGSTEKGLLACLSRLYDPGIATTALTVFGFDDEMPQTEVEVAPFYIDQTEVTNKEYERFVQATGRSAPLTWPGGKCPAGRERYPVTNVTWHDAAAYAEWVGKRLPTESEWELAARGIDGREYPWGSVFAKDHANTKESGRKAPMAVGSLPTGASPYGCLDMVGNVSEWTGDVYAPYSGSRFKLRKGASGHRVLRGGSWMDDLCFARAANRFDAAADQRNPSWGFRCAKDGK